MFCVYLTIYTGSKMPMFYIGSSSIDKVNKGYRGSVSSKSFKQIWKKELKENPNHFKTKIISRHNDRKSATMRENEFHKVLNVVINPLYLNMANATPDGCFGISDFSGKNNPMFGKTREDARLRMLSNNPMHDKNIARKVTETIRLKRLTGDCKSTRNSEESIVRLKLRMLQSNPSSIKLCCVKCMKETNISWFSRLHINCQ